MGYRSDIRILIPLEDYSKLKEDCLAKYGEDSLFNYLGKEEIRRCRLETEFSYFGWDYVKWYDCVEGDGEIEDIESAVYACGNYHVVRMGENPDDLGEDYNLNGCDVEPIGYTRSFMEDSHDEKEINHEKH